ncbi:MAG: LLM class flavin-dependent oxidoreductase [Candidatus Binataceae bacterium]|jgi:limonene 1,2-monooxygenase
MASSGRLRFGLFVAPFHPVGENPTLAYERDLDLVQTLDRLGFDEVWFGERHSCGWETIPAPDLMIAAAAMRTQRLMLGAAVVSLPFHHPFDVAERFAFLDHLTRGRVMLGVGPGALPADAHLYGVPYEKQSAMMNEGLEIILRLYRSQEAVTHNGTYFKMRDARLQTRPLQSPHLPIGVACGGGINGFIQAGKHGIWPISAGLFSSEGLPNLKKRWAVLERAAEAAGRTPSRAHWRLSIPIHLAESRAQAVDEIRAGANKWIREYFCAALGASFLFQERPDQPIDELSIDRLVERGTVIVGTPQDAVTAIEQLIEHSGGFGTLLAMANDWASHAATLHSFELLARYVMPHFQGTLDGPQAAYDYAVQHGAELLRQSLSSGTKPAHDAEAAPDSRQSQAEKHAEPEK